MDSKGEKINSKISSHLHKKGENEKENVKKMYKIKNSNIKKFEEFIKTKK